MPDNNTFKNTNCQEKYDELFDTEQIKAKYFDEIASIFFDRNFSTTSKSDIELFMFNILMKQIIAKSQIDGTLDYNKCSDYAISKILGITEAKVRNLKIKKELIYPEDYNWIYSFASILSNSKLTTINDNRVLITIPDPNVMIEVKNFLEEQGDVVEVHLNPKILEMDIEYLLYFALKFEEEQKEDIETINKLRNEFAKYCGEKAFSELRNSFETVDKVCSLFNAGNTIVDFIKKHKKVKD